MYQFSPEHGLGTIALHAEEGPHALDAHASPIYQTSVFGFKDVLSGSGIVNKTEPGYYYTRLGNPNLDQVARKIAILEAVDLLRDRRHRLLQIELRVFARQQLFQFGETRPLNRFTRN